MVKSKLENGLPFQAVISQDDLIRIEAQKAFNEIRSQLRDEPEMSLEEINEEIKSYREDKRNRK